MIVQLQLQPVYKVITLVGMVLCLLATRATGTSEINAEITNNFVSLTCKNAFNERSVNAIFFYTNSKSDSESLGQPSEYHNFTLNKTNEGKYTCKFNSSASISEPKTLIPIPVKLNISSNQSFTWGEPLVLNCAYQPGVYPDGYTLIWEVRVGGTTKQIREQQNPAPFSINSSTHELSVPFYTPLLEARYQCKVTINSLNPSNYNGDNITVSTKEGGMNKLLAYPDDIVIQVNETYSFTCEASVKSNEMMTFKLFDTTMTTSNMGCHTNGNYTRLNCPNLKFCHVTANIFCDFLTPYNVSCTYLVIGGLQEGDFTNVSCSIGSDKQTWKLTVRASVPDPYASSPPTSGLSSMTRSILSSGFFATVTYILLSSPTSTAHAPYILTFSPTSELFSSTPYLLSSSSPTSIGTYIPSFSPTSPQSSNSASSWATYLIITIAISIVVLLFIGSVIIIIVCLKRRKNKSQTRDISMTPHNMDKYSLNIKNLTLATAESNNPTVYSDNKEEITEILRHTYIYGVSSSYLKRLSMHRIISGSLLQLQETVGQGEFGIVYRGLLTSDGDIINSAPVPVAVKTLKGLYSKDDVDSIMEESLKMSSFDHPNVLSLIGVCLDFGQAPCIVMPFMARGSLLSYLKKERLNLTIAENSDDDIVLNARKQLLSMCLQVAKGMLYLAQQKFVHRDLAARNCMIDASGIIKVADFGLSKDVCMHNYFRQWRKDDCDETVIKLPVKWMALESLHDGLFSEKTDVWSYGVLCWEVFSVGKTPYPGLDPLSVVQLLDSGGRLLSPNNAACSEEIYKLMMSCWKCNPNERPTFSDLIQSVEDIMKPLANYIDFTACSFC